MNGKGKAFATGFLDSFGGVGQIFQPRTLKISSRKLGLMKSRAEIAHSRSVEVRRQALGKILKNG